MYRVIWGVWEEGGRAMGAAWEEGEGYKGSLGLGDRARRTT
jgi:hypothetical protein